MMTNSGRTILVQGRLVWTVGDLFKGRGKTDFNTKAPLLNAAGEQKKEYGFGLAVPKSSLAQIGPGEPGEIWAAIHEEAYTLYPSRQIPPSFAMKYKDGDGIDDKGVPFSQREGYAGHLVFACTTALPVKWFKQLEPNTPPVLINEGVKCGDYVNVQLSIRAHAAMGQGKPGLYLNPMAVMFLGYGKEIINAPSGEQIFGTVAPPMPPGASATPLVSATQNFPPAVQTVTGHYAVLPQAHQPAPQAVVQQTMPTMPAIPR
jgi:hypothetical protein